MASNGEIGFHMALWARVGTAKERRRSLVLKLIFFLADGINTPCPGAIV
jgi:hypothetical protein